MRLAIQDSWPNLPVNAEREFIKRFQIACENLAIECHVVVTSDDILAIEPEAVFVSHEFSRKLTGVPTIGMIWSPLSFFRNDPYRVKSLLSYDGYLAGNSQIQTYLKDLQFGVSARKPISKELFLPTSYRTNHMAVEHSDNLSLSYVGVHWDGTRHRELFDEFIRRDMITCYGPEASWKHISKSHGGFLPIDGRSVIETIASHGVALCLHKAEHRAENTPSMRLFEALSVGALPICDDIGFARDHLADFVDFIDLDQGSDAVADQVSELIEHARRSPVETIARARRAKTWFDDNWSLEHKIENVIIPLIEEVRSVGRFTTIKPKRGNRSSAALAHVAALPDCEVVIRTGGRTISYLERAILSVKAANSADFRLGVILVDYMGEEAVTKAADRLASPEFPIRYLRSANTGFRSTALWDGINAAKSPFVAHMDDDDSVFGNHYRQLADCFAANPTSNVCYTGVIKIEDEPGFYTKAPNYDGPLDTLIEERRDLHFLESFNLKSLAKFVNFIQSNTWMVRRDFVQQRIGPDPELVVVEDIYLYLLLATAGPFAFTGSPTAQWHWRSATNDNSMRMIKPGVWDENINRIRMRLRNMKFSAAISFEELTQSHISSSEVQGETDKRTPDILAPLNFNRGVEGGSGFRNRTIMRGFYPPEGDGMGVWSKDYSATVLFNLSENARQEGGFLIVEYIGSKNEAYDRWVEMGIEGGNHVRLPVTDWSMKTVELALPAGLESPVVLKITSSHLVEATDAHGNRQLGCFLRSIRVVKKDGRPNSKQVVARDSAFHSASSSRLKSGRGLGSLRRYVRLLTPSVKLGSLFKGGDVADARKIEELPPLDFGEAAKNGAQVSERAILQGFYKAEGDRSGIWSNANSAILRFCLGQSVRATGGNLIIEYAGSSNGSSDRWLEFGLDGEPHKRVEVKDWSPQKIKLPLRAGLSPITTLKVTSSHLVEVASDEGLRRLGCFIMSLSIEQDSSPLPTLDSALGVTELIESTFASGTMPDSVKSNLRLEAVSSGLLIILGRKGVLYLLPSIDPDGCIVSRQAADGSAGFLYLAEGPFSSDDIQFVSTNQPSTRCLSFAVERAAELCDYIQSADHQRVTAVLPPGALGTVGETGSLSIKLGPKELVWEVRPHHGSMWTLLQASGESCKDDRGELRTGVLPPVFATLAKGDDRSILGDISVAILAGILTILMDIEQKIPSHFLTSLAKELVRQED